MAYLYETHLHTCQSSACARSTGAEHARYYKSLGFAGIIVTDHFFRGNSRIPREGTWEERVNAFCAGYEDARAEGERIGLDVLFGWEEYYEDDEYLVYGLDKAWLLQHPEVEHWTRREQLEQVHRYGGCVVQAHPFRERSYIRHVRLGQLYCDAVEAANAGNDPHADAAAYRYARHYGLPMTAGSDNHLSTPGMDAGSRIMGLALDKPLNSIHDLVRMIRNREPLPLHVPQGRWDVTPDSPLIDAFFLDENEKLVPTGRDWLRD